MMKTGTVFLTVADKHLKDALHDAALNKSRNEQPELVRIFPLIVVVTAVTIVVSIVIIIGRRRGLAGWRRRLGWWR